MTMKKILDTVLKKQGWSRYRLAKELGLSTQAMDHLYLKNAKGVRVSVLIKLQEISGYTVEKFWRLLKDEHGHGLDDGKE
jgi:DNA-binding Xre family transcriptional regulator